MSGQNPTVALAGWAAGALVFGASAAVLVVEIVALRLLAPYLGLTLETSTLVIGTALAATTSPSGQYICSSSAVTVSSWRTLTTRKIAPNPANIRMAVRSVVTHRSLSPSS